VWQLLTLHFRSTENQFCMLFRQNNLSIVVKKRMNKKSKRGRVYALVLTYVCCD